MTSKCRICLGCYLISSTMIACCLYGELERFEQHCSADDEKVDVNKFSCILNINLYMLI